MSELDNIIRDTVGRLFSDAVSADLLAEAERGTWPESVWATFEENGLPAMLTDLEAGTGWSAAFQVAWAAGWHCLPLPLPEAIAAGWLLARAGIQVPEGRIGLAGFGGEDRITLKLSSGGWRLDGTLTRVPWGRWLTHLAVCDGSGRVALVQVAGADILTGTNLVGEPRDSLRFGGHQAAVAEAPGPNGRTLGALIRSAQMAGAIGRVLDLTLTYAGERQQFGKPIAAFQAVQHMLAVLAEESAAAFTAAQQACLALDHGGVHRFAIAAAKVRTGEAAGAATALAHQVLGAMGFAREHPLHHATRRLMAWRAEFGNEAEWATVLADMVLPHGGAGLWPFLVSAQSDLAVRT